MLAHKAVHEAHVAAAEVIAGELQGNKELAAAAFNARVIPSVAYTDPEVAWVGLTEDQAKAQGIKVKKGLFPWTASGRAIANGRDEGVTKLLFDDSPEAHGHGKILGGGMVGTHAGDMIGEIALAIEMGADAVDIGKTIHPHPTLGESIGMAAEVAHGSCTDVPPAKKLVSLTAGRQKPELATVRALCFVYPSSRRRILCICTVLMSGQFGGQGGHPNPSVRRLASG